MSNRIRTAAVGYLFVLLIFLTSMAETNRVLASEGEATPSLEGLHGIAVMVMPLSPDAERTGLKREQVHSDIETKLRKAGIKILTDREMEKPGFPYLNININAAKDKKPEVYSYSIKAELYKQVIQNPQDEIETAFQSISIKSWSSEANGTASAGDFKNSVQKQVDDTMDKFVAAYLSANPKK